MNCKPGDLAVIVRSRDTCGKWIDLTDTCFPSNPSYYRIKPEPVKVRYRVALLQRQDVRWTNTVDTTEQEADIQAGDYFAGWLTDWQEAEVPQ